jgi:hypothetical protein
MSVLPKLMQARLELAKRDLKKTGENKFAGYKYFELGDFLPTGQVIFAELGLCGVVSFTADLASLTITDTEDGSFTQITSPMGSAALKGCHEVQNIGAVETYQRRYLWVAAFEIVEHDALDATTGKAAPDKPAGGAKIKPTDGAWEAMDADQQVGLQKIAADVADILGDEGMEKNAREANAFARIEREKLDSDEKTALWTLLDSKTRSAIKRAAANHAATNFNQQKDAA